ncbi:unnamed protein product [Urochloa humidicola]
MANSLNLPTNFQINAVHAAATANNSELRISNLYLHHSYREPSSTHQTILSPNGKHGFGATVSNNWAIYNGPDPSKDVVVAYAQGLHIQSGRWHNSFTLAFEIDGLKDSTLQVMGLGVENTEYWSIVGGTGKLTLAQGFIYKRLHKTINTGNIIQLEIYVIFRPTKITIRDGPKGAPSAAVNREPKFEPDRLESITIGHNDWICSVVYTYVDKTGTKRTESIQGYTDSKTDTVELGPTEFVKEISGTIGNYAQYTVLTSLTVVTNLRTLGPYGKPTKDTFSLPDKKGGSIVGFFGWAGAVVDTIGVLVSV